MSAPDSGAEGQVEARAEVVSNVWKLLTEPGAQVTEGDVLAVLESMKMEIPVNAPVSGRVVDVQVVEGQIVQEGDVLAVVEPS